jgi:hypothetical protein
LGTPCAYLLWRGREKNVRSVLFAAVTLGLLFGFCFDFIAEFNNAWSWNGGLLFGKILGVVQIDVMIWFFLWVLHIILVYEHFIDTQRTTSLVTDRGGVMFFFGVVSVLSLVGIFENNPEILVLNYAYLKLCILVSLPFLIICLLQRKLVLHAIVTMPYFAFVYLTHEITALPSGSGHFLENTLPGYIF